MSDLLASLSGRLSGADSFGFATPLGLGLGLAAVLGLLVLAARRPPLALPWPARAELLAAGARSRDPLRGLALGLRALAAGALVAALCGPTAFANLGSETRPGLDLMLVVDASGSMRALDARVGDAWRRRLDLAREVVGRFALHRVAEGDRVGLVVFGDSAFTLCPLTSDGALLQASLERLEAGMAGEATALGDALVLAVKRVSGAKGDVLPTTGRGPRAGRLVVLLTDGRSNAGTAPSDVAAGLAAASAIRVHTVGIGTGGEVAMQAPHGGRQLRRERHDLDLATLRTIAGATGGRSFDARSSLDLAAVYAEIDELERVPRPAPPRSGGEGVHQPFLASAGLLLALELLLARVLWRRIP